jgi:hypothetical protein
MHFCTTVDAIESRCNNAIFQYGIPSAVCMS